LATERANSAEALLADARAGDPQALGRLLDGYRNYLLLFAQLQRDVHLQGRLNPSDFVQDAFLRACRSFRQFRGTTEAEFLAWLRQILVRCVATAVERELKAGKRNARREVSLGAYLRDMRQSSAAFDAALVAPFTSPADQACRRERAAQIADELARLPGHYREVIVLRNLEGLPFEEVGRRMGRSTGAVRILWLRALDRWRQITDLKDST
jgi:RNA polymerase sigma-70 factor (ECF subfamily)